MDLSVLQRLPPGSAHVSYTCAAVTALGGLAGYVRARSIRSLGAGAVFGAAYALAGHFIATGEVERGLRYGALSSAALAASMSWRLSRGARVAGPVGALAATGILAGGYHGLQLWRMYEAERAEDAAVDEESNKGSSESKKPL